MRKFILVLSTIIILPIVAFLLFYFLVGFTNNLSKSEKDSDKLSKRAQIAIALTVKTAKILSETRNLRFNGFGGSGGMQGVVKMRAISLTSTNGPFNIEQARELVIYCAKIFLKEINNSKEIRPYLHHYPFTVNDIEVRVAGSSENKLVNKDSLIAYTSLIEGKIDYCIRDECLKSVHEETYKEALEILNKEEKL
jgi:hypothetical protein